MRRFGTILLASAILVVPVAGRATTWHVPSQCPTIQAGVDSASAGDTVLVACGTYHDCTHSDPNTGYLCCVVMKPDVHLRSYAGDPECATIDAERLGRVFYCGGFDSPATIDGFTITNGLAAGAEGTDETYGGGIFCRDAVVHVTDCILRSNEAYETAFGGSGGAIAGWDGSWFVLTDCCFQENRANAGGSCVLSVQGRVDLLCSSFTGNWGSALFCYETPVVAQDCGFTDNTSAIHSRFSSVSLDGCAFIANRWGTMKCESTNTVLDSCSFVSNHSGAHGGAVLCTGGEINVSNCLFSGNSSDTRGGALYLHSLPITLTYCTFEGNSAQIGGCVFFEGHASGEVSNCLIRGNESSGNGGGAYCFSSTILFSGCTFVENAAQGGAGVFSHPWIPGEYPTLENCMIVFSTRGQAVYSWGGSPVDVFCCDIYGNALGDYTDCIVDQCGIDGNFSECPLFCDLGNGDFQLQECSPCAPGNHPDGYNCGVIGAFGVDCECGLPSAAERTSWSSLKALYR